MEKNVLCCKQCGTVYSMVVSKKTNCTCPVCGGEPVYTEFTEAAWSNMPSDRKIAILKKSGVSSPKIEEDSTSATGAAVKTCQEPKPAAQSSIELSCVENILEGIASDVHFMKTVMLVCIVLVIIGVVISLVVSLFAGVSAQRQLSSIFGAIGVMGLGIM